MKFNIIDEREEDWIFDEYTNGKFENLRDEHLVEVIIELIREAIVNNVIYYDFDDAERATQEVLPVISSIVLNPLFRHVRHDYDLLVEIVTYLTFRLA